MATVAATTITDSVTTGAKVTTDDDHPHDDPAAEEQPEKKKVKEAETADVDIKKLAMFDDNKTASEDICCPNFESRIDQFQEKEIVFDHKPFVKESTWCFWHFPLNFGGAVKRATAHLEAAGATVPDDEFILLADLNSKWSTRILFPASKDWVPEAEMVHLTGTFLTKVFEGPYSDFDKWITEMKDYVKESRSQQDGFDVEGCDLYAYYATCPKCAKKYGKNYTVLFAKVDYL